LPVFLVVFRVIRLSKKSQKVTHEIPFPSNPIGFQIMRGCIKIVGAAGFSLGINESHK
jgi:hypothetical protein